jgi:hypothetical protein
MTDKPDGKWLGWLAVVCAISALIVVTAIAHCQTPIEIAASRLRVGMTQKEAAKALGPEVTFHSKIVFWDGFKVELPNGLKMTFADDKLTGWEIGHPADDLQLRPTRLAPNTD